MTLRRLVLQTAFAALTLLLTACDGLAGDPVIVSTLTPLPPQSLFPPAAPDIANGARLYAANCTACHGISGAGDGESVLSGAIQNPGIFNVAATADDQTPRAWFSTITEGRMENLMPPWGAILDAQERWDVALFTYTLHYDSVEAGRALVESSSALSSDWQRLNPTLSDSALMAETSDSALRALLAQESPAFAALGAAEQTAVAQYARTLTLRRADAIGQTIAPPITTPEVVGAPGTITGRVANGTAGGTVPADTQVTLHFINADLTTERLFLAPISADGSFVFSDVPFEDGANYFASVPYQERVFASTPAQATAATTTLHLPITIYESTDDVSVIRIVGTVLQVSPSATGDGLEFLQVIRFRNTSDRLFSTNLSVGASGFVSLVVELPPGAAVLGMQGQERYVVLQEQYTVIDTLPVLPDDEHLVQIVYFVPYDSGGAIIEQPFNYALDGAVRVLLRSGSGLTLQSAQLAPLGPQMIGSNAFESFGATLTLNPRAALRFDLNGALRLPAAVVPANNVVLLLVTFTALVVLALMIFIVLRQRTLRRVPTPAVVQDKDKLIDTLVRQIAALDEQHDKGEINHDLYQQRRAALKARLAELMEKPE
ncbi:MAG: cytochrome c [Chloroflexi bacterium]|nr:cytochrome c [Chloroflexota bacterium]